MRNGSCRSFRCDHRWKPRLYLSANKKCWLGQRWSPAAVLDTAKLNLNQNPPLKIARVQYHSREEKRAMIKAEIDQFVLLVRPFPTGLQAALPISPRPNTPAASSAETPSKRIASFRTSNTASFSRRLPSEHPSRKAFPVCAAPPFARDHILHI